jgi:hypothetical protein
VSFLESNCTFQPLNDALIEKSDDFLCNEDDLNDFFLNSYAEQREISDEFSYS